MNKKTASGIMLTLLGIFASISLNLAECNNLEWASPELLVDNESLADETPSVVQDTDGKLWVAFSSGSNMHPRYRDIWIVSSDDGVSWSVPIKITSSEDAHDPHLIQDASGNYLIAFERRFHYPVDNEIWTTTSTNGIEWSAPISTGLGAPFQASVSLFQDCTGRYLMAYLRHEFFPQGHYRVVVSSSTDFVNWDTPIEISYHGHFPCVIQDSAGKYRVIWSATEVQGGPMLIFASTSNDGVTWSTQAPLSVDVAGFTSGVSLIQDTDGTYLLAWGSGMVPPGPDDIFLSSSNDFATWTTPQQLTTDNHGNCHPSLLQDSSGAYWVVWMSNRRGEWDIWYSNTIMMLSATVDLDPNTLNLKGKGKWITCYIELPEGYNVGDIDVPTTRLNETFSVDPNAPTQIGDYDGDCVSDLMVKFNRTELTSYLYNIIEVKLDTVAPTISGQLTDGTLFGGSDIVRVRFAGDVNEDCVVDVIDLSMVGRSYGARIDEETYEEKLDLTSDGVIDMRDLLLISINYGATISE